MSNSCGGATSISEPLAEYGSYDQLPPRYFFVIIGEILGEMTNEPTSDGSVVLSDAVLPPSSFGDTGVMDWGIKSTSWIELLDGTVAKTLTGVEEVGC